MSDLYDTDILEWSERQAALLHRRAAGELVNEAEIDWSHIAEEIEDVGNNQLRTVASHLVLALLHDLRAEAWPLSRDAPLWRAEARGHRDEAREAYAAVDEGPVGVEGGPSLPSCPAPIARHDGRPSAAAGSSCLPCDTRRTAGRRARGARVGRGAGQPIAFAKPTSPLTLQKRRRRAQSATKCRSPINVAICWSGDACCEWAGFCISGRR